MTVLCYHTVEPDWSQTLAIEPDDFDRQCAWLATHRTIVPVERILEGFDRRWRPSNKLTAITFDDGWSGVYTHAWPILRRHGLPFTVFVVADTMLDRERAVDWVRDPPCQPLRVLSPDQVREMHEAGVDIASHSLRHADLTALSFDECVEDLRSSREILESTIEAPIRTLAYPSGRHDASVRRAAAEAGFSAAFSLPERAEHTGRFAIPRVGVYPGNSLTAFRIKTQPRYLDVRLSAGWTRLRPLLGRFR